MKSNVVLLDRTIRMGAGAVLLASPLLDLPTYPINLLGLVLMATAAIGYCPLYALFGVRGAPSLAPVASRRKLQGTP
jgi:hypothetical protein